MEHVSPTTETLWLAHVESLRGFIRRRVSDEEAADDLLQETFLRVHGQIGGLNDPRSVISWVFQIARNLVTDYYRGKPRAASSLEAEPPSPTDAPQNLNAEATAWALEMIHQLPDIYRQALTLHEVEGMSQKEIANQLGISHSGARARVQRGRQQLKGLLEDCCTFEQDGHGNIVDYEKRGDCRCDDDEAS